MAAFSTSSLTEITMALPALLGALSLSSSLDLTTIGNAVAFPIAGTKRLSLSLNQVTGSGATLAIDGSRNGGFTWVSTGLQVIDYDLGTTLTALVDDGDYRLITKAYTHIQVRVVTAGAGAALVLPVSLARPLDTALIGAASGGGSVPTGPAGNPNAAVLTVQGAPGGTPQPVAEVPFIPIPNATTGLSAGPTATAAPVALATVTASTYRIRNAASSASPVAWRLATTNSGQAAVMPVAASTVGTGGAVGDKTIDPGGVEIFSLTAAQQTAIAAGSLFLSAVTPSGGSATIYITPGVAGA